MKIQRRKSKIIKIGDISIGGNNPIAIQSMAKSKTSDIDQVVRQINRLKSAGCEIVRLAVKDREDARSIRKVKARVTLPIVADIHFDWRLAIEAVDSGADKIRLNPGNIYKKGEIREVVKAAKLACIPIRVGVNSGSVIKARSQKPKINDYPNEMVRSAMSYIRVLESFKFHEIVISLKASNVLDTIEAYHNISKICDYPLHLGVTATGAPFKGAIKTCVALGALLLQGIGDTIRVSLTDEPVAEVVAAKAILESLELRRFGHEIISCPTCGRCEVDLVKIVKELEAQLSAVSCQLSAKPKRIAVMGCVVNGPGEAKEADIGVAFGKNEGLLFKKGKAVRKVAYSDCARVLLEEAAK